MQNNIVNRVEFDISWWKEKDKNIDAAFGSDLAQAVKNRKNFRKGRYDYHRSILRNYRHNRHRIQPPLSEDEKFSLRCLKDAIAVQRQQLYPDRRVRTIVRVASYIKNFIQRQFRNQGELSHYDQVQLAQSTNRRQLVDILNKNELQQAIPELDQHLKQGLPEFLISLPMFIDKDKSVEYRLPFRRNDHDGTYSIDRYDTHLIHEFHPENNRSRTFKLADGHGITASQAINLLEGRAIEHPVLDVTGQQPGSWIQLSFNERDTDNQFKLKRFLSGENLDLDKAFEGAPFLELGSHMKRNEKFEKLRNGDIISLTYDNGDKHQTILAYADPKQGLIQYMDLDKKPIAQKKFKPAPFHPFNPATTPANSQDTEQSNQQQQQQLKNNQKLSNPGQRYKRADIHRRGPRMG